MATESTLRYIKLDYQSQKDALQQRIRDRWPSAWNDFLANNIGIVLIDIVAWGLATMAYIINRVGAENYVSTMTLRESAVRIGSLTGYQLRGPTPATVSCEATLTSAQSADVTLQKGTLLRSSDTSAVPFEIAQDYTIRAGSLAPIAQVAIFNPSASGSKVINSFFSVTSGAVNADLVDSTIDLTQFISAGQTLNMLGDSAVYTIQALESAPGAISQFTRVVLNRPWAGTTGNISAEVDDRRIQLIQGQTVTERFVAPAGDTSSFSVKLGKTPVIDNSASVSVNGEPWTSVSSIGLYASFETVYQIKTLTNGSTVILFGDNIFGLSVSPESAINVTYRVGGGSMGNIGLNTINTSITGLIESLSNPVPVLITNNTSVGVGGQEAETLDQARVNIPVATRNNDRAVTLEDYQALAQRFVDPFNGSVAFARSTVRTENGFLEGNIVVVYAWTTGQAGGLVNLTPQLKLGLQTFLQGKALGTDLVEIFDGTSRPVPISLRFKTLAGFSIADTQALVFATINNFVNVLVPGSPVIFSSLMSALDGTFGVDTVNIATPISDLTPNNTTELFTVPQDTFVYSIQRTGSGSPQKDGTGDTVSNYTAQLPIFPLAVWSFRLFLGTEQLTVVPDVAPGFARIFGTNISDDTENPAFWSRVNLLTGQANLWITGAPGDLTMELVTVQGYSSERVVNVYVSYVGDNSQNKRREIRSALRAYSDGLQVGGSLYATPISSISASLVSIQDVVANVSGIIAVTRVALDSPASTDVRVTATDFELLKIGNIYINNQVD